MSENRVWSLIRRMRLRLFLVTVFATMVTSIVVGYHYGSDFTDLRQRKVMELAERLANELAGSNPEQIRLKDPAQLMGKDFIYYPNSYGWRVQNRQDQILLSSNFPWNVIDQIPDSNAEEWTHEIAGGGRVAGKQFACGNDRCVAQIIIISDPANMLIRVVWNEIFVHIIFPVAVFYGLFFIVSDRVIRQTLRPISDIGRRAQSINSFQDSTPIQVHDAPLEVRDLTVALNAALARLRQLMEREREFVLDASHALRTPLAAVLARLDVDQNAIDAATLRGDLDALVRLCEQMLSSAHADRLPFASGEIIDLERLVIEVASRLEPLARAAGVELAFEGDGAKGYVDGHSDALAIALVNLIENAIQHSPPQTEVVISLRRDPLRIMVQDAGPGVSDDRLASITERFVRGPGARSGGAGLGLSIVARVMAAHGGRLELRRTDPKGLSASLIFPSERRIQQARSSPPLAD